VHGSGTRRWHNRHNRHNHHERHDRHHRDHHDKRDHDHGDYSVDAAEYPPQAQHAQVSSPRPASLSELWREGLACPSRRAPPGRIAPHARPMIAARPSYPE
jgi:hypothetical protein